MWKRDNRLTAYSKLNLIIPFLSTFTIVSQLSRESRRNVLKIILQLYSSSLSGNTQQQPSIITHTNNKEWRTNYILQEHKLREPNSSSSFSSSFIRESNPLMSANVKASNTLSSSAATCHSLLQGRVRVPPHSRPALCDWPWRPTHSHHHHGPCYQNEARKESKKDKIKIGGKVLGIVNEK